MVNYKQYLKERKDKLHDRDEKLSYLRSKLGLNRDGLSEPADDTDFVYSDDRRTNDPNEVLMARVHDAEYRDMEDNYAAKKLAVQKAEAEIEKDELEKKVDGIEKSNSKLKKLLKKIQNTVKGLESNNEEEETSEPEQPAEGEAEQTEEPANSEVSEEQPEGEETAEKESEETEKSEEEEEPKNILNKKLDLSWTEKTGEIIEEKKQVNLQHLFERLEKEKVVRDGKLKIKYKTDKADKGYKVSVDNEGHAREERMTPREINDRKRQQRRAQLKRNTKFPQMTRNRLRSMRVRRSQGLDRD